MNVWLRRDDGSLYAVDATSETELWRCAMGGAIQSSPAVANGYLYCGSSDDGLYAFTVPDARPPHMCQ